MIDTSLPTRIVVLDFGRVTRGTAFGSTQTLMVR